MPERVYTIVPHKTNSLENATNTPVFSVAGFKITTNLEPSKSSAFQDFKFSQGFTLESLEAIPTPAFTSLGNIHLNLDQADISNFITYGSTVERIRVAIENIIFNYPAALFVRKKLNGVEQINVLNASYNPFNNTSTFIINTNFLSNPFGINYLKNVELSSGSPLRNIIKYATSYELEVNNLTYSVIDIVGSDQIYNDKLCFTVEGKPFTNGNSKIEFFIKLKEKYINDFYHELSEFEYYLINPEKSPYFYATKEVDAGNILNYNLKFEWPKIDKYNLDISTSKYSNYLEDFISFAKLLDETQSNVILRSYTPFSLKELTFNEDTDTFPEYGKIPKLLLIYGRHFDEINTRIKNLRWLNRLTYDGRDNLPDNLIKNFALTLGWTVTFPTDFNIALWKQLLINTFWVWKAKGTRKAIEFVLSYMNIPNELIEFDEYVYVASKAINISKFNSYLEKLDSELTLENIAVDETGKPKFLPESEGNYFQNNGNNDNGWSYFQQFNNLMPTFTGSTARYIETTNTIKTFFEQDFLLSGNTLDYDIVTNELATDPCFTSTGQTVSDPLPTALLDECGCPLPVVDKAMEICTSPIALYTGCSSTPFFLDVWFNCSGGTSGETVGIANIETYGGTPPYTFVGLQPNEILTNETAFSVYAIDSNGCLSDIYEGLVICGSNICSGETIDFALSYTCLQTNENINTGNATLNISNIIGGTAPYTSIGAQNGDIVVDGQTISVKIIDANGCESEIKSVVISCPVEGGSACNEQTVELQTSLEVTSINNEELTAILVFNYDIFELPEDTTVDQVVITATDGINPWLIGDPVISVKSSASAAQGYTLNFDPDPLQDVTMTFTVLITLDNGCQFTTTFPLSVSANVLADVAYYNEIIIGG